MSWVAACRRLLLAIVLGGGGRVAAQVAAPAIDEPAAGLAPDAVLTIAFPFRDVLDFAPESLNVLARYEATRPDEAGVRRETGVIETCPPIRFPLPRALACKRERVSRAYARTLVPAPAWFGATAGAAFSLRLPETLPGPGGYRLTGVRLPPFDEVGGEGRELELREIRARRVGESAANAMADFIHYDTDRATGAYTAAWRGARLELQPSQGSQAAMRDPAADLSQLPALQDAQGKWHISPNAFLRNEEQHGGGCKPPQAPDAARAQALRAHAGLAWIGAEDRAALAIAPHPRMTDNPAAPRAERWTGCVTLRAESAGWPARGRVDERRYVFVRGRVVLWDHQLTRGGAWLNEAVHWDGEPRALFAMRNEYVSAAGHDTHRFWNRLVAEVLPERKQEEIPFDFAALQAEMAAVRELVAAPR